MRLLSLLIALGIGHYCSAASAQVAPTAAVVWAEAPYLCDVWFIPDTSTSTTDGTILWVQRSTLPNCRGQLAWDQICADSTITRGQASCAAPTAMLSATEVRQLWQMLVGVMGDKTTKVRPLIANCGATVPATGGLSFTGKCMYSYAFTKFSKFPDFKAGEF